MHELKHHNHLLTKIFKLSTKKNLFFNLLFGPLRISLKHGTTLSVVFIKFVNVKNVSHRINSLSFVP